MIAAIAGIGVPIDGTIRLYLVCWISILVRVFAIRGVDRGRISGSIGDGGSAGERSQGDGNRENTISQQHFLREAAPQPVSSHASRRVPFGNAPAATFVTVSAA